MNQRKRGNIYPLNTSSEIDVREEKFSVYDYMRKINSLNQILMSPDFQRNMVWTKEQESLFIESLLLNIPIPPFYMKRDENGKLTIVDGLQRTMTMQKFFNGALRLTGLKALPSINNKTCAELRQDETSRTLISQIEDKQLFFYIIQPSVSTDIVYDIFSRINQGGTTLTRQEIRNCIYIGESTKLLKELAESAEFLNATGKGVSTKRMKDREAVLRCISFCLLEKIDDYHEPMDRFLEDTMKLLNRMKEKDIKKVTSLSKHTMAVSANILGRNAFRRPTGTSKGRINIAILETVFRCIYKYAEKLRTDIGIQYQSMLNDPVFITCVTQSTSTKSRVIKRFHIAEQYLTNQL